MKGFRDSNNKLSDIFQIAQSQFNRFIQEHDRVPTGIELTSRLDIVLDRKKEKKRLTLFQFIDSHIEKTKKRRLSNGKTIKGNTTLTVYKQTYNLLKEFSRETSTPIDFESIDMDMYDKWVEYMEDVKDYAAGNIGKHIKTLKTFLNEAIEQGLTKNRAHQSKHFRTLREGSFAIALTEDEVQSIYELDLSKDKGLEEQRDVLIVACSTALRFSDVSSLTKKHLIEDNGKQYIQIKSKKTSEVVSLPLDHRLREIIKKYSDTVRGFPTAYSNQVINRYLKEIGKRVESLHSGETISKTKGGKQVTEMKMRYDLLTTHTGRRTFATLWYKRNVAPQFIMKLTGHKTESAFFKYIRMTPLDTAKVFEMAMENQNLRIVS